MQKGGTLVTFGQAGDLPIQRFNLPVRNVVAGLASKEFWSPGSTLRVRFDNRHPIAFGMPRDGYALFLAGSQVYEVTTDEPERRDLLDLRRARMLQSGWLLGENVIARKAAALTVGHGAGTRRPARLPAAASRPDARHVQARLQRAVQRTAGACGRHDQSGTVDAHLAGRTGYRVASS